MQRAKARALGVSGKNGREHRQQDTEWVAAFGAGYTLAEMSEHRELIGETGLQNGALPWRHRQRRTHLRRLFKTFTIGSGRAGAKIQVRTIMNGPGLRKTTGVQNKRPHRKATARGVHLEQFPAWAWPSGARLRYDR